MARQFDAIGVRVTVKVVAPSNFLNGTLDTGDFQLAIDSWSPGPDPDVSAFWRSNAVPPRGYDVSGGRRRSRRSTTTWPSARRRCSRR